VEFTETWQALMWQAFCMGRQNLWIQMKLHRKKRATDIFILKFGEGTMTLASLTATVMASIS
jgi:hypothetical protein